MNLDEAIKLVVTLHTPSEKLQRDIIAKDMDLKMVNARALELTQRVVRFMKNMSMGPAAPEINSVSEQQHHFEQTSRNNQHKTNQWLKYADTVDSKHHTEENVKHEEQHATNARKKDISQLFASPNQPKQFSQ